MLVVIEGFGVAPWYGRLVETLRTALMARHPDIALDIDTLASRAPVIGGVEARRRVPDWLARKYADHHYDIVFVADAEVVPDIAPLRDRLWPEATLITSVNDEAQRNALRHIPGLTGIVLRDVTAQTVQLAFRLQPGTQRVAMIGNAMPDDPLRPSWRATLSALRANDQLIDLSGLSLEALRARLPALPPHTVVYFASPGANAGRVMTPRDLVTDLAQRANAPILVDAATMLGTGVLGGALNSPEALALDVARQVERLLAGERADAIGFEQQPLPKLQFDWQALKRWRVPLDLLPPGSEVIGRPPGLWEAYRSQVLAGVLLVLLQSGLIAALLLERRRRRVAEGQAREHLAHLARLNRGAALGALSAALVHEINQPLGAILANVETAELLLERPETVSPDELRELMAAIREDDQRAAAVFTRLRAWIANTPGPRTPTALNPLISDVTRMLDTELRRRDTELQLDLAPQLPEVLADGVQIQQVVLNLMLNALDALREVSGRTRRIVVTTALSESGMVVISVADNGPGLKGTPPEQLFEPFFSTKAEGLGVGLAISRSILEQHHGRIVVEEMVEGVRFRCLLPSVRPHPALDDHGIPA